jgi:hypothetical protein
MRWVSVHSPAQRLTIVGLAGRAARERPDNPALQLTWANATEAAGEQEEALRLFHQACERFPGHEPLHAAYAAALGRQGQSRAALDLAEAWLPATWACKLQFRMLLRLGNTERLPALQAALALADPLDPDLLEYLGEAWRGEPERLLRHCDRILAGDPGAMHAVYHKAVALAQIGRAQEAAALMALDRFVEVAVLDMPPSMSDGSDFHGQLEAEILANPTRHADPAGHASRHGLRTAVLPLPGDHAGPLLVAAIQDRIQRYAATLTADHPFAAGRPDAATFKSWALLFRTRGHQAVHHHPGAWLTGVYYAKVPPRLAGPGALRVGSLPAAAGVKPPWRVFDVQPTPGTLVLFPSYVPHETIPSGSEDLRISIAFDVTRASR